MLVGLGDSRVAGTVAALGCCGADTVAAGADEVLAGLVAAAFCDEDSAVVATAVAGAAGFTGAGVGETTGAWLAGGAPTFSCRPATAL